MSTLPTVALRGEMPRIGRLSNRHEPIGNRRARADATF
jgi:hypothetical protein